MKSIRDRFREAPDYADYVASVGEDERMWQNIYRRTAIDDELVDRVRDISGQYHFLALTEDWCGDAQNTLPAAARLAEATDRIEMRVLLRDQNLDIMDAHLTNGKSRSIPIVIVYDEDFNELGWWGPRPGPLAEWVEAAGQFLEKTEKYAESRKWYVKDAGKTTARELLQMVEQYDGARA